MSYRETLTTEDAFVRYEQVRHRGPDASFPATSQRCDGLIEIAGEFDAFILDSFGVLNVGEHAIPGAPETFAALRALGKRLIVLTNAASYDRDTAVARYARLGFDVPREDVVSSRDVAVARLEGVASGATWAAVAAPGDSFEDIPATVIHWQDDAVDGFLLLSSASLSDRICDRLETALTQRPRPVVVANPDLVAPRESGLSKEPGYYAHLLADRLEIAPLFFGKPFGNAFEACLGLLPDIPLHRIAMVGDTLHTDILGGRAAGLRTVLVENHGLFAGQNVDDYIARSGIVPDFRCNSI